MFIQKNREGTQVRSFQHNYVSGKTTAYIYIDYKVLPLLSTNNLKDKGERKTYGV